jgi:2-haloacid dehalogenase
MHVAKCAGHLAAGVTASNRSTGVSPLFDFAHTEVLTFDCYGTLIDWEQGILRSLRPILAARDVEPTDEQLLESHARHETRWEAGPYLPYREVLARTAGDVCNEFGVQAAEDELRAFAADAENWPPFADSHDALARLSRRYHLGVITNCDDDIFESSRRLLNVEFEWVVTAQAVGTYKPSQRNFEIALATIGLPREHVLHVAQSLFHDHLPARRMGLATAWIDRRRDKAGFGATPPASVEADLAVPDMASFARAACGEPADARR